MKKITGLFFCLILVVLFSKTSFAQSHDLIVEPPTTTMTYLNDIFTADVTANNDPLRVYVLRRNSMYFINAQYRNTIPLNIRAENAPGRKPIIFLVKGPSSANLPGRAFDVRGNLYLKNIMLDGYFEYDAGLLGNLQGALITTSAAGFDVVADSCIILNTNGNHIRTDSAPRIVKVTNTIFGNMGYLGTSNFGAGKALDLRAGSCDSLIMVNNTFVNAQDRIIRHYSSTANIKYMKFDHNTIVNSMSYHGTLSLGKVGKKVEITNNMFYDSFSAGSDTDRTRQLEFADSKEYDVRNGLPRMSWVITEPNDTTQYVIKNNFYVVTPALQTWYTKYASAGVTGEGSPLTWAMNKKLGADSTTAFRKISTTLTKIPNLMVALMDWYRDPNGGNKTKNTPTVKWDGTKHDYDRRGYLFFSDSLRCSYSTSSTAYTGGLKGFPAGDLNWFPSMKTLFDAGGAVGVTDNPNFVPVEYTLNQNYPNPFNPTTNISYSLPKAANVTIAVYNSIGQEIALLINNQAQNAGKHQITWNGKDASGKVVATGVYFYQMKTNEFSMTKKMLLLK